MVQEGGAAAAGGGGGKKKNKNKKNKNKNKNQQNQLANNGSLNQQQSQAQPEAHAGDHQAPVPEPVVPQPVKPTSQAPTKKVVSTPKVVAAPNYEEQKMKNLIAEASQWSNYNWSAIQDAEAKYQSYLATQRKTSKVARRFCCLQC
jgi:hypothetical protein